MRISTEQFFDSALVNIQRGTADLGETQKQIATGIRILTPSDDPVANAKVIQIQERVAIVDQYQSNIKVATSMNELSETVLGSITDSLQRIRELTLQANSGALTQDDREIIATEMRVILDGLQDAMNTNNGLGGFLYSGFQTSLEPFLARNGGGYDYVGDEGSNFLQISASANVKISDSGKDLFIDIPTTNPTISTRSAPGNSTSPGSNISVGTVTDPVAFKSIYPEDFVIEFNDPEVNQGRRTFSVTRASDGRPVMGTEPPGYLVNVPFDAGSPIEFNGIEVAIVGEPKYGDRFLVESTSTASVLNMVHRFAEVLETLTADNVTLPQSNTLIGRATPGKSNVNTAGNYVAAQQITVTAPDNSLQTMTVTANQSSASIATALNALNGVSASAAPTQATLDFSSTVLAENESVSFLLNGAQVTATVGASQAATMANIDAAITAVLGGLPTLSSVNNGDGTFTLTESAGNDISVEDFQVTDLPQFSLNILGGFNVGDTISFDVVGSAGENIPVSYTVATGTVDEFLTALQADIAAAGAGASFNITQPGGAGTAISLQYLGDTNGNATIEVQNFTDGGANNAQLTVAAAVGTQTINQNDGTVVAILAPGVDYAIEAIEKRATMQFQGSMGDPVTLLEGVGDSSSVAAQISISLQNGYSIASTVASGNGGIILEVPDVNEVVRNRFDEAVNTFLEDLDRALDGVTRSRAELGARLNTLDNMNDSNDGTLLELKTFLSDLRDLDYAEAVSRLNLQTFIVDAAQQSFVRITQLSLFRLL